ncbi:MAG: methylmalonyl-CoA mutase family protein [Planctomycetota bacterium]|nr:methylmalonyl-CoA mutase family protein [Planctomycetota bacterium]
MSAQPSDGEEMFPPMTRTQWRERAGSDTSPDALSTQEDRPAGVPLGERYSRGWLRIAALHGDTSDADSVLSQGSEGLELSWSEGCFEGLADLEPTTPIVMRSHSDGLVVLDAFGERSGILHTGFDPLGCLARDGHESSEWDGYLQQVPGVVQAGGQRQPSGRALRLDTGPWQGAGANLSLDLAAGVTNLLETLRAAEAGGVGPDAVASQLIVAVAVGSDIMEEVARLRALRVLIERVLRAAGVASPAPAWIHARGALSTHSLHDPMTNALRATNQTIAGVLGGADAITTAAFDALADEPGSMGARLARNTQSVLAFESHLARVADPAAGSYHLERRTEELARSAWERVRVIEARGGAAACLLDGWWQEQLDAVWAQNRESFEAGEAHVLGASQHRGEDMLEHSSSESAALAYGTRPFPLRRPAALFES